MCKYILYRLIKKTYHKYRCRNAPTYANPTSDELALIERELLALNISIENYTPSPASFNEFKVDNWFPLDYHGGQYSGVWDEKLLEHWLSCDRLGLMNYAKDEIFVDVAAASSPWAEMLRTRKGLLAFAVDLFEIGTAYKNLSYYRIEDATQTSFHAATVQGLALHCAFEMFMGEDDTRLIAEAARILKPG